MIRPSNTSLVHVATRYSNLINAKVTATSLRKDLEESPFYPSLYSLSAAFNRYHINNDSFEIPVENFSQLEAPFITLIQTENEPKDYVLVEEISETQVTYIYKKDKPVSIDKEKFLKYYTNVVWMAESTEESGEPEYLNKRKKEGLHKVKNLSLVGAATLVILLAVLMGFASANLFSALSILLIKFLGIAAAVLILIYENNKSNSFVKSICQMGKQTNCGAVLGSKAATIKGISWGEIGLFYFTGTTIFLLLPVSSFIEKISWLAFANALAVPYIFFSVYYQWKVVKQWCTLCLAVQFLLAAELLWSVITYWQYPLTVSVANNLIFSILFSLLLPVVGWYSLKSTFKRAKDYNLYSTAYKRLQYHPDIFSGLLSQQPRAAEGWDQIGISVGNPSASTTVIKVCNPYCGPCAKAHPVLEELAHTSDVHVKIIFTATNAEYDRGAIVVKHLLAIAQEGNPQKIEKALDDWYNAKEKDYEAFSQKYPMNGELKMQDQKIESMRSWCLKSEITYTPTVFVNGYRLPENYQIEELKNIF